MESQTTSSQRGGAKLFMLLVFILVLGANNYYWYQMNNPQGFLSGESGEKQNKGAVFDSKKGASDEDAVIQIHTGDISTIDFNTFSNLFRGAPKGVGTHLQRKLDQPDFSFALNINSINRYLTLAYGHQIPLGEDTKFKKDYISFEKSQLLADRHRGMIHIKMEKGKLKLSAISNHIMDVNKVRGELLPQINIRGEDIFLDFRLRIISIDVKGRTDVMTASVAHHLNDKLIDLKGQPGLISINLSKLIQGSLPLPSRTERPIAFELDDASLFFEEESLNIHLNLNESIGPLPVQEEEVTRNGFKVQGALVEGKMANGKLPEEGKTSPPPAQPVEEQKQEEPLNPENDATETKPF